MTDLNALLERVEGASGPSVEIDARLLDAVLSDEWRGLDFRHCIENGIWLGAIEALEDQGYVLTAISANIDAALALVEKVLPGWCVLMAYNSTKSAAIADVHSEPLGTDGTWLGHARAQTLPLAILAALLRALSESSEGKA